MYRLLLILFVGLLTACSTTSPQLPLSQSLLPGAVVETVSSTVTVSLRTADRNLAARGVMLYRRPDQLRLVLLSPFGTTLMEAQLDGEQLTLAYPANGVAYQGQINELPPATGQRGFAMLRWVLATDTPPGAASVCRTGWWWKRTSQAASGCVTVTTAAITAYRWPRNC